MPHFVNSVLFVDGEGYGTLQSQHEILFFLLTDMNTKLECAVD